MVGGCRGYLVGRCRGYVVGSRPKIMPLRFSAQLKFQDRSDFGNNVNLARPVWKFKILIADFIEVEIRTILVRITSQSLIEHKTRSH